MIDQQVAGFLMVGALGVLLLLGTPIGLSLASAGIAGLFMTRGWGSIEFLLGTFSYSYTANIAYIVLPLFLFMGHMTFVSGVSERAFSAAQKIIGHVSGGLAVATVMASAGFAMVCGSSVAAASTMGRVAIPEMLSRGYGPPLAAGCVAAGGTLGVLIPPSGILVVYSIATQVSLVDLFLAALIPGFLTALIYGLMIHLLARFRPRFAGPTEPRQPLRVQFRAVVATWEIMLLFAIVMGSIYLGIATPTEAAAVGAVIATLLVFRQRGNRFGMVREGLLTTGASTASIFLLILGAGLFSLGLSTTQLPVILAKSATGVSENPYILLILILVPYFILGMFIDGISMILLTMPIVFPIITELGLDPVWFGIIVTKTVEIGLLTPPVGLNAFVVKSVAPDIPMTDIYRGCLPFVLAEIGILILLIAVPELAWHGN